MHNQLNNEVVTATIKRALSRERSHRQRWEVVKRKEVCTMKKQTVNFAIKTEKGVVREIGRSAVLQPNPKFKGGSVKWFDDSKLIRTGKA